MSAQGTENKRKGNIRELLDALPKLAVLQDVKRLHLLRWYAMDVEDLHRGPRETALGSLGVSLHEQNDWRRRHGLLYLAAGLLGDVPPCEGCRRRCEGKSGCTSRCTESGKLHECQILQLALGNACRRTEVRRTELNMVVRGKVRGRMRSGAE